MASKKVFLSPSDQSGNTYAAGKTNEQAQCERITAACKAALERSGVEVKVALNDQPDWTAAHVTASNNWGPDLHVAIHSNAVNGKTGGAQVYYGGIGEAKARLLYNQLKAAFPADLPNTAEGVNGTKANAWVEFTQVKAYTLYVETNFHDVPAIAEYIVANVVKIGEAIAAGICAVLGVTYKEATTPAKAPETAAGKLYRVQVGAFRSKTNAELYLAKVKEHYPEAFLVAVDA